MLSLSPLASFLDVSKHSPTCTARLKKRLPSGDITSVKQNAKGAGSRVARRPSPARSTLPICVGGSAPVFSKGD